jgi:predicted RNA-binding Zn-ribbon protein involved in translation (DUF1610 family)
MEKYTADGQQIDIEFYCPACGETHPCRVGPAPFLLAPGQDTFECPGCHTAFTITVQYTELFPQEQ